MMLDLAAMTTSTTGTGTLTLVSAVTGRLTFAAAGAVNGGVYTCVISDGVNTEVGPCTYYNTSGITLTRPNPVYASTNGGSLVTLGAGATAVVVASAESFYTQNQVSIGGTSGVTITSSQTEVLVNNTTGTAVTVNLPANPLPGEVHEFFDIGNGGVGNSSQYAITINGGANGSLTINSNGSVLGAKFLAGAWRAC